MRSMKRICAVFLCLLLAGLCACEETTPEETGATSTLIITIEQTTIETHATHTLTSQRISSPNPFFDGMETERWVMGTSSRREDYFDEPKPMLLRTTKIRDEKDGPVYEIVLEIPEAYEGLEEMHLGDFLVQDDRIFCYPLRASEYLPDKIVVCRDEPWSDDAGRIRQSINHEGDIAEYSYIESYMFKDNPFDWRFGLTLYFRWEKGKGLTGYCTGDKVGAAITEFGGIGWWDWLEE